MRHSSPFTPQFFVTAPQDCPYLEDRKERKLFTSLDGSGTQELNDALSKQGFRRSQNVLYRPSCPNCSACMSARVRVADFKASKSQRRVRNKNAYLIREAKAPWATEDQYELFREYLDHRHSDGGMADMDVFEFAAMIEETPVKTRIIEYYAPNPDGSKGELVATCLSDLLEDGISMVYSFFKPELISDSLGTFVILDHIEIAREAGLPFAYLGYWVPGSPKMGYKARFSALEIYKDGIWQDLSDDVAETPPKLEPVGETIAQQVASIALPDIS